MKTNQGENDMKLFEPKTPIFFGTDPEQITKAKQLLKDYDIAFKLVEKNGGVEITVARSNGDQGEYLMREMKQGRMRWKNESRV